MKEDGQCPEQTQKGRLTSMFTGIVEHTGSITDTRSVSGGRRLRIGVGSMAADCAHGASICVSGVCLTVARATGQELDFDVIAETIEKSTLGSKCVGDQVNLERSLQVGDRLNGHFVQGHVDGRAIVDRVVTSAREYVIWLRPEQTLVPYIVPKGSVAVDGVSLTIAAIEEGSFSVALTPTTLERTTLSLLTPRDSVNIETDIITRTIIHHLAHLAGPGGLTIDALREAGFA
jgi:riboflavin synthase